MSGAHAAKDALLAELLGDMDQLLTRFDQWQKDMEELQASIQHSHDVRASQAVRELEAATVKFGEVTTQSVDDFVSVGNEALSKFIQRTNEIKDLRDNLATKPPQAATVPASAPTPAPQKKSQTGLFSSCPATKKPGNAGRSVLSGKPLYLHLPAAFNRALHDALPVLLVPALVLACLPSVPASVHTGSDTTRPTMDTPPVT